jgi:hypothetical protein
MADQSTRGLEGEMRIRQRLAAGSAAAGSVDGALGCAVSTAVLELLL